MMKYTVDRFEGDFAVLLLRENEEKQFDVKKENLPSEVKEGDILDIEYNSDGSIKNVQILKQETNQAKKRAEDLIQKLVNKNKK